MKKRVKKIILLIILILLVMAYLINNTLAFMSSQASII